MLDFHTTFAYFRHIFLRVEKGLVRQVLSIVKYVRIVVAFFFTFFYKGKGFYIIPSGFLSNIVKC